MIGSRILYGDVSLGAACFLHCESALGPVSERASALQDQEVMQALSRHLYDRSTQEISRPRASRLTTAGFVNT